MLQRVDWRCALHLPLTSLGVDREELDEYQKKLLEDPALHQFPDDLLQRVRNLYESLQTDGNKVGTTGVRDVGNEMAIE